MMLPYMQHFLEHLLESFHFAGEFLFHDYLKPLFCPVYWDTEFSVFSILYVPKHYMPLDARIMQPVNQLSIVTGAILG